jgi:hypothetical protein
MACDHPPAPRRRIGNFTHPFALLGFAGVLVGSALLKGYLPGPLRAFLVLAALLLAAGAVSRRLQGARQELEERILSAAVVSLAGLVAILAYLATPADWDSIRLLLLVLALVSLCGSALVLLPCTPRRIAASLFVLFHFGGIATAVTAVAPRDQPAPWLATQLWQRVYRPYLQLLYLTNAYHFYSPDPGPPSLLWFRVHYSDSSAAWIKLPVRQESPIALNYQRMLALAEGTNSPYPRLPLSRAELAEWQQRTGLPYLHDTWETLLQRRQTGGALEYARPLYLPADAPVDKQYSEPNDYAKLLIGSYARHVARTARHPTNPQAEVVDVRVYRLSHRILTPAELTQGFSPLTEIFYQPYFFGKFDPDGDLIAQFRVTDLALDALQGEGLPEHVLSKLKALEGKPFDRAEFLGKLAGLLQPDEIKDYQALILLHTLDPDPFLYWYIPIAIVPKEYGRPGARVPLLLNHQPALDQGQLLNGLVIHAAGRGASAADVNREAVRLNSQMVLPEHE